MWVCFLLCKSGLLGFVVGSKLGPQQFGAFIERIFEMSTSNNNQTPAIVSYHKVRVEAFVTKMDAWVTRMDADAFKAKQQAFVTRMDAWVASQTRIYEALERPVEMRGMRAGRWRSRSGGKANS
ncbi:hypothetical protein ACOSP7_009957 [Xanthoceras sorbifolium]